MRRPCLTPTPSCDHCERVFVTQIHCLFFPSCSFALSPPLQQHLSEDLHFIKFVFDQFGLLHIPSTMADQDPPPTPTKIGANGQPLFTYHINQIIRRRTAERMATNPSYDTAGFSPISDADSPARRDRKLSLLNTLSRFQPQSRRSRSDKASGSPISSPIDQPEESIDSQIENSYYFGHAWTFWHDKHAPSGDYEGRLTLLQDDIMTVKLFWEVVNSFPLQRLGFKDSVHFFKRGVKPVWEDPRNVNGRKDGSILERATGHSCWRGVLRRHPKG